MDKDTSQAFKELGTKIDGVHTTLAEHVAFDKGLNLPKRMTTAESNIRKKASWTALVSAIIVLGILAGIVFGITKGVG